MADERRLWISGYPPDGVAGSGEGIWEVTLDVGSGRLTAPRLLAATPSPSFLAVHPDGHTLYAVGEVDDGLVSAFRIEPGGALTPVGTCPSAGSQPCHVVATTDALHVANYGDGTFAVLPLAPGGGLAGPPQAFGNAGNGPDAQRQEGPHAHSSGGVDDEVWVADLGTDRMRRFRAAAGGIGPAGGDVVLPAGSGPRHFVTHGDVVVVATELDSGVVVLAPAGPGAQVVQRHPACFTPAPVGELSHPSHIAVDGSGTRLHVAVRGPDVLATFAVSAGPAGPRLRHLADTPVDGRGPRHFAVVGELVVVANQHTSELVVLRVDATGRGAVVGRLAHPAPACVLPAPLP